MRAPSPFPRPLRRLLMSYDLLSQDSVGNGPSRQGIKDGDWKTKRWGLRKSNASRDHCFADSVFEVLPHIFSHLIRQLRPSIEHSEDHSPDSQICVEVLTDQLEILNQL